MGKRGPKKKTAEPPPLQTPQGVAGKKRTPTSSFDPSAGKDIYEPEKIVATRGAKGGASGPVNRLLMSVS